MRRYPITLHQQSPIILGKNPKRERKIQSRSPVFLFTCNSHLQPREPCGSRHHRPSKDTRTRPVRSRTSPSILNTKHTDKDRKLDEPPHGDHGVYKEPTRLSRTSSYLNSISLNLRPTDRLWAQDTHCVRWGGNLVGLRQLRGAQGGRQIGDMADKHAAARTSTTWPAPAATTPKAPRTTRGDAQGNGRKTASQRLRAHRGLTLHIDEPDKEPTSPTEATAVSAFVRIGDSRPTSAGLYGIKQEGGGNAAIGHTATNQPKATLIAVVAQHHLQAREIAGECAVVRTSAIRRYSPLLNEEIPNYFTSTEPYYSREKP